MSDLHGGNVAAYRLEHPGRPVLDFSANINPLGLPEGVRRALTGSAGDCEHYPDPRCRALRGALSRFEGVPEDWILCGNGASDLICRIAWALRPGTALLPAPTFSEYGRALEAAGCEVRHHPLREGEGFAVGGDFAEAVRGAEIVFLCNPGNPTGALVAPAVLEAVLRRCAESGATLVVDECFLGFVEGAKSRSMKRRLGDYGGLIVLRAFTKLFAMPGLRLGYALCSDGELLARLDRAGPPWSVSAPAQSCGIAAVGEAEYLAETARYVPRWRAELSEGLAGLGCRVYPAAANYVFFRGRPGLEAELLREGILLRSCANFRGLKEGYYRAAVRTAEENAVLLEALGGLSPAEADEL